MLMMVYNRVRTEGSLNLSPAWAELGKGANDLVSKESGPQWLVWVEFDLLLGG